MKLADDGVRKLSRRRQTWLSAILFILLLSSMTEMQSAGRPASLAGFDIYSAPEEEGAELIGQRFKSWDVRHWINSEPLTLDSLRGKVVLIRWWTAPGCPFCEASAPALNEFWQRYRDRGLIVLGFYHHKANTPLNIAEVKEMTRKLGFQFPVAVDPEWRTLRRWWLQNENRGWTSITVLLDRHGIVRHVHPGGAFFKGDDGYEALKKKIELSLAEPAI
jgi:thiol-disulfide isomerase/thioredoxin